MSNKDRLNHGELTILNAQAATGAGTAVRVGAFQHAIIAISSDGGAAANLTVNCQGSISDTAPTWTGAQTRTNMWDYIHMWDLQNATGLAGDTGLAFAVADDYRVFMVNVDGLQWLNFRVTAWVAGNVTVTCRLFSNL